MGGFKKFLMQGNLITIAVGLVIALAFSTLIEAFTGDIITPLINAIAGKSAANGLGWKVNGQVIALGSFISAIIYFIIFVGVVYALIVVPYRSYMAKKGSVVYGDPPATKDCPECLSAIPAAATRCAFCTAQQPAAS
ncbi:MAG: MscL family protein [Acidimicrobiales bacterium]